MALEEPAKSAVVPQRLDQAAANTAAVASQKNPDKRILPFHQSPSARVHGMVLPRPRLYRKRRLIEGWAVGALARLVEAGLSRAGPAIIGQMAHVGRPRMLVRPLTLS